MANHISLMLDSMFTAVDEGLSYDGIVSASGTGLEDRPRLTVLLHDGVDLARMARLAILRGATRVFRAPPQDHAGLTVADPETVAQAPVPVGLAEDFPQLPEMNRGSPLNVTLSETDEQDLSTPLNAEEERTQGPTTPARAGQGGIGIQSHGEMLHTGDNDLTTGEEMVIQNIPSAIGLHGTHAGEQPPSTTPLRMQDCDLPVSQGAVTSPAQVASERKRGRDVSGIQSGIPHPWEKDDDPARSRARWENADHDEFSRINRSWVRTVIIMATCTVSMGVNASNISFVSIALPEIGRAINIREDQLQWLLSAYFLSSGCLLLFFGHLSDLYGCKNVFALGMIWQASFSLGCGFSSDGVILQVLRGLQGVGAAATIPSTVGILHHSFPPSSATARSALFAIIGAAVPAWSAFGTIIGGVLTELTAQHWRSPFFLSAALSFACFLSGRIFFDRTSVLSKAGKEVDWIGIVLMTSSLVLIMFALGQGPIVGWKTSYIITSLIAGVTLGNIFLGWEYYLEKALDIPEGYRWISVLPFPLIKLSLWTRARGRMAVILFIIFLNWCGFTCWVFWVQLYYQDYLQLSPLGTVIRLIPIFVADFFWIISGQILAGWVPLVVLVVSGALSTGIACLLFALVDPSVTYWAFSFPSTVLVANGANIVNTAGILFVAKIAKPGEQNLVPTMSRIGAACGLTVSTIVFNSVVNQQSAKISVAANAAGSNLPRSVALQGYKAAQWTGAGFSFLAALLAVVFLRGVGAVGYRTHFGWSRFVFWNHCLLPSTDLTAVTYGSSHRRPHVTLQYMTHDLAELGRRLSKERDPGVQISDQ